MLLCRDGWICVYTSDSQWTIHHLSAGISTMQSGQHATKSSSPTRINGATRLSRRPTPCWEYGLEHKENNIVWKRRANILIWRMNVWNYWMKLGLCGRLIRGMRNLRSWSTFGCSMVTSLFLLVSVLVWCVLVYPYWYCCNILDWFWFSHTPHIFLFVTIDSYIQSIIEFPNKQLRPWISTQRSHYRFKQEGKPSQMTDERVNLLNSIGFPWKTKEDWQTRFNELILFFHEHGNLQVPRVYMKAPKLYRWTNCQKMEMQKHAEGQLSRLKPDQIKMLENIGFEWNN